MKKLKIFHSLHSLFLILIASTFFSCGGGGGGDAEDNPFPDLGDFKVGEVSSTYNIDTQGLKNELQNTADILNSYFKLSRDIYLSVKDCGIENAYYNPNQSEIVLCTELLMDLASFTFNNIANQNTAENLLNGAINFIFGHELGHALIDNLNLPVLGKEEDAVDSMSVVLNLETADNDEERIYSAIGAIWAAWYIGQDSNTPFYDEHSMAPVRLANIVCWAAGGEPYVLDLYPDIRNVYYQMVDSGRNCKEEYEQQKESTVQLLKPYLKKDL